MKEVRLVTRDVRKRQDEASGMVVARAEGPKKKGRAIAP